MNKALIVAPSWIGDTIMAQPLFARLHAKSPGLQLDALAPSWVAPVLQRMGEIAEVLDSPFGHGQLSGDLEYPGNDRIGLAGDQEIRWFDHWLKGADTPQDVLEVRTLERLVSWVCDRLTRARYSTPPPTR